MADRTKQILKTLQDYGENHGYAFWQSAVVIVGPGAPYNVFPTMFEQAELQEVIDGGLLEKRKLSGALNIETYAVKPAKK